MSTYQILSLIVSPGVALLVGAAQVWVVLRGINAMKEASEIRDRAHERRHQETMTAIKSQHNEAMEKSDRQHRETMEALDSQHQETMEAIKSQHNEAMTAIERRHEEAMEKSDRQHRETMTTLDNQRKALEIQSKALETLIERTAPV